MDLLIPNTKSYFTTPSIDHPILRYFHEKLHSFAPRTLVQCSSHMWGGLRNILYSPNKPPLHAYNIIQLLTKSFVADDRILSIAEHKNLKLV